MADELGPAVSVLQRKLDEQLQGVADTKRTINMLMKMSGKEPLYPEGDGERSGAVRADQFYGKGLATSAAEYLAMRQQACQPDEIFHGLQAGGFDFTLQGWKGEEREMVRSLSMSLAKNTGNAGKFHRLKNGSFGLRVWYDPKFLKKAGDTAGKAKKKKAANKKLSPAATAKAKAKPQIVPKVKPDKLKNSAKVDSRPVAEPAAQKAAS